MFPSNITLYVPECCKHRFQKIGLCDKLEMAFQDIKTTSVGKQILEDISACNRGHKVWITTHDLTENHDKWINDKTKCFSTHPTDLQAACDPKKGSGSFIYVHIEVEARLPRTFTQHHHEKCVKQLLVSECCSDQDGPCTRTSSLDQILFHELVHARNNLYGENKKAYKKRHHVGQFGREKCRSA